ncbi:MAG: hypothetical protein P4N59_11435 [Negativicutes bacterium]|nr:hypothetical protein [Negativicutes bacterium]
MDSKTFMVAYRKAGSVKKVAQHWGCTYGFARKGYLAALAEGLIERLPVGRKATRTTKPGSVEVSGGQLQALATPASPLPAHGVKRYLFTCAQNDTRLHEPFWDNLKVLAAHYDAEIHVSRFAYVKAGLGTGGDKSLFGKRNPSQTGNDMIWDPRLTPYLSDTRLEVAPGLVWCGEMNILPTASRPLSGFETYTGRRSAIFPHVKIALESIASSRGQPAKFNYTTGAVTQRNYIQKKAGLKAEFHHCYGALLVEVDSAGDWFCRQINADSEGTIYDLDLKVSDQLVTTGIQPVAITWGDIHVAELDPGIAELNWGDGGILDTLRPHNQFFHDVLHFRGRSHHEVKNPHKMFVRFLQGFDNVKEEVKKASDFLWKTARSGVAAFVVDSNHHHHVARWLQEQDGRFDPVNSLYWLALNQQVYQTLAAGRTPNYLEEAFIAADKNPPVIFLGQDESWITCPDAHGGIENGMHGDLGPNGSRGSALNLSKMGRKAIIGHSHSARIVDSIYQVGTCGTLDPDWSAGPSSWSHSHCVTYPNGKRAIITLFNGKWRAT